MRFGVFCLVFILTFSSLSALAAEGASANGEEPLKGLFDSYKKHSVTVSAEETPASSSGVTEKAIIQRVNEELALLSASIQIAPESIKADLDGRAVICENVTITNPETPGFAVTIEKILVSGVDAASYAGSPGDMTEVENLSFHNIRFSEGGATKATLDKYSIEGFSFAYRDAIKALQEQKNGKADTVAMPSYMSSYKAKLSQ
ncbi:hypothetical protein LJB81_04255, partial [Desulfovibrio sp. OttesenSCG-928-M14]|nr:hypothetical protein [Desulfovibrio sp. OttesenSCG-928-M14]